MRIVYMGTPDFAVPALSALAKSDEDVVLVVTQPDQPRDRGKKMQSPPVKVEAEKYGIPVLQPEKIKGNLAFYEMLKDTEPDLIVVAAYGRLLPKDILDIPKRGCINIHASLLPKYRGAAPIHRAVINGESETGVTLMYMSEGMDEGDMLAARTTPIGNKTTSMLFEELAALGAELLMEMLPEIKNGTAPRTAQDSTLATHAPMVFKKDTRVDFSMSATETECLIRGVNSWPGAWTTYKGESMKIWEAQPLATKSDKENGTVINVSADGIDVACGGEILRLTRIQMPGKKATAVSEFVKGNKLDEGTVLGV